MHSRPINITIRYNEHSFGPFGGRYEVRAESRFEGQSLFTEICVDSIAGVFDRDHRGNIFIIDTAHFDHIVSELKQQMMRVLADRFETRVAVGG